ncbi:MAG: SDH family Clp fold serine proteinase [Actinomycetota bacterium]
MPSWGEILGELKQSFSSPGGPPDYDGIRRKYLIALHANTGRNTILYATDWFNKPGPGSSITLEDMQGMMEVCRGLRGPALDLILHSPGGSAEATASIVRYLRRKFSDIRVFVPLAAMSAATMWALSANEIYMGKHSQLGPVDPQLITAQGQAPARAIIEQFEKAKEEISENPALLGAWVPILQQYGPALIIQCEKAEELARKLVGEWLEKYMFGAESNGAAKAKKVADWFADYATHPSHALGISRDEAKKIGANIQDLEKDQELQDLVLSVHHATMHTFAGTGAVKVVENQSGRAFVKTAQVFQFQVPGMQSLGPSLVPGAPGLPFTA